MPEIAFAGRSNVGKSSLLNALTNRKGLARTSNTPGRTQELNFFDVGEPLQLRLVDMPGYGFAEAPQGHGQALALLVNDFLRGRAVLKRALVLVDSRHGLKDVDREMMEMLDDAAVSYHLVLTKGDKVKPTELGAIYEATQIEAAQASGRASRPSSRRRAKRVAASPSCGPRSSKPRRPEGARRLFKLIIGNRAYSSWSMRGWLACKQSGEEFEELVVPMFDADWDKRREGDEFAPSLGKVPILWDGEIVVWDSLAIIEFLADRYGRRSTGRRTKARAAWRGRWPRRCTPASPTCAANCR